MSNDLPMVEIEGLKELAETFEELTRKYPDRAGNMLVMQAKELRKDVVRLVKNDTDTEGTSKKSLAKAGSYGISPVKGYGNKQYIEVSAKSPHFHLVENGHMKVIPKTRTVKTQDGEKRKIANSNGGATVGFTPGYHFMDRAAKKSQIEVPEGLKKVVDSLLREEGLI